MEEGEIVPVIHSISRNLNIPCQLDTRLLGGMGIFLESFEKNGQPLQVHLVRFLVGVSRRDDEQVGRAAGNRSTALECSLRRVQSCISAKTIVLKDTDDGTRTQCRSRSRGALKDAPHTQVAEETFGSSCLVEEAE